MFCSSVGRTAAYSLHRKRTQAPHTNGCRSTCSTSFCCRSCWHQVASSNFTHTPTSGVRVTSVPLSRSGINWRVEFIVRYPILGMTSNIALWARPSSCVVTTLSATGAALTGIARKDMLGMIASMRTVPASAAAAPHGQPVPAELLILLWTSHAGREESAMWPEARSLIHDFKVNSRPLWIALPKFVRRFLQNYSKGCQFPNAP
jgi:hypothetical protein